MGLRTISPQEAFQLFHRKDKLGDFVPFSITYYTANLSKGTGGDRRTIHRARLRRLPERHEGRKKQMLCVKDIDSDAHPVSLHVPLIDEVNGRKMTF